MNKRTNVKCISWLHCHDTSEILHDRAKTRHGRVYASVKKQLNFDIQHDRALHTHGRVYA